MEKWVLIPNFEEYAVSNYGNIKNVKYNKLRTLTDVRGYLKISLNKGNFSKMFFVHRLVALLFIDNPENKPQVNHIDGNKKNNYFKNLEWCTARENDTHARNNNLKNDDFGKNKPVKITDEKTGEIFIFVSVGEASGFLGIHKSSVARALKKRNGIYHGYFIEYI